MRKLLFPIWALLLTLLLLLSWVPKAQSQTPATPAVTTIGDRLAIHGVPQDIVWGRSCFKLANHLTYHYKGIPGRWGLESYNAWVDHMLATFGPGTFCRVFLETGGWSGHPMFGSPPSDQGFWEMGRLFDGDREREVHPVGRKVIEHLMRTSHETGLGFELVIDATLKHFCRPPNAPRQDQECIPPGEIDHVIRQVGVLIGELSATYPRALIIISARNEWNAHNRTRHTLDDVNMWAVRFDRDRYWPGAVFVVDGGGANSFEFDVGPEPGKYRMGLIHPERDENWFRFPNQQQKAKLVRDSRGQPWGFSESMLLVDPEDCNRARQWYGPGGWSCDWVKGELFLTHVESMGIRYMVIHDEKGMSATADFPRPMTRVDLWARAKFKPGPPPPPVEMVVSYRPIIDGIYQAILARPADPSGLESYDLWFTRCMAEADLPMCQDLLEESLFWSDEYQSKFRRPK